jgi:predicted DNA-binding protein with PD1-like motif
MEYRRFGDRIAVRMDRGDEVCAKLLELAEKENIRLASVTGIGASNDVTLGVFNTKNKEYSKFRFSGLDYEIASITGNLSRQDGKPYLHLHAAIGNPVCDETHAGHLNAAVVSATAELMVGVVDGEAGRKFSDEVGLNLFAF